MGDARLPAALTGKPVAVKAVTIKVCGLSEPVTLEAALAAGVDMVGFVFFPASPRHVTLATARDLGARVEGRALKVALSVDANDAALAAMIAVLAPDLLQLHGSETPERVAAVRARFGLPVMRAVGLATSADLAAVAAFDAVADRLLFDAKPPSGHALPGGNGAAFDWTLLRGVRTRAPWLLAGGLRPDTVASALRETGAPGLDVSSGVERTPGVKDPAAIARFVAAAREGVREVA